jgi:competence protein ComEC
MKRPLLPVVLLFVCGILAAEIVSLPLLPILGASLFLAAIGLSLPRFRHLLLYPLLVFAGFANSTLHTAVLSPVDLRRILGAEAHLASIRGHLVETPTLRVYGQDEKLVWRTLARVDVSALRLDKGFWQPSSGRLAVTTPGWLTNFVCGQFVEIAGVAAPPRPPAAEGTFDYRQYLKRQGIYYQLQAESESDWRIIGSSPGLPVADQFSRWARHALALGLPSEDESVRLEWALALGWKTALNEEASEPFVRAATYHIFAVDGLRMAIVFGIFYAVLRALGLPRALRGIVLIPLIWFYVALTGWPASAIRATVMLTLIIVGWALKRPSNPINSLFTAALIILAWDPQQLFQAGFQLSFCVVLCLILMIPPVFEIVKKLTAPDPMLPRPLHKHWPVLVSVPARYVTDLLVTSFAAWIGSIPLVAYYFNILTPVSTPANILAVPLCVLVLVSNLISLLFASWFPAVAELFNYSGWFCMETIRVSSHWFAHWPAAYYYIPAPGLFTIFLYYALLLAFVTGWVLRPAGRAWKFAGLSICITIWGWNYCHQLPVTNLFVLPTNGGTSIYCDAFGIKKDLLIDIGSSNSVQYITKGFLRAQGVNRSPVLILSHGDLHHIGGAHPFLEAFDVRHVYASPLRFRSVAYRRILERLGKIPGLLGTIHRDDVLGDWTVLHPSSTDRFARADDGTVVLKGVLHRTRVLLLSDLGRAGQNALLVRNPDLRADIVVAGLPAADEPLSDALIAAVQPRLIIISDSEFPVSERANPKLRARLSRAKLPVLYTRTSGAVHLEFRDGSWELRTMNGIKLNSAQPELASAISEFDGNEKLPSNLGSSSRASSQPGTVERPTSSSSEGDPPESSEEF